MALNRPPESAILPNVPLVRYGLPVGRRQMEETSRAVELLQASASRKRFEE